MFSFIHSNFQTYSFHNDNHKKVTVLNSYYSEDFEKLQLFCNQSSEYYSTYLDETSLSYIHEDKERVVEKNLFNAPMPQSNRQKIIDKKIYKNSKYFLVRENTLNIFYNKDINTFCSYQLKKKTSVWGFNREKEKFFHIFNKKIKFRSHHVFSVFFNTLNKYFKDDVKNLQKEYFFTSSVEDTVHKFHSKKSRDLKFSLIVSAKELYINNPYNLKNISSVLSAINYRHRKYGTQKVKDYILGTSNKKIQRFLLENSLNPPCNLTKDLIISDDNNTIFFIDNIEKHLNNCHNKQIKLELLRICLFLHNTFKLSPKKINNFNIKYEIFKPDSTVWRLRDSYRMLENLARYIEPEEFLSLDWKKERDFHDTVMAVFNKQKWRKIKPKPFSYTTDKIERFNQTLSEEYTISLPKTDVELKQVGESMRICVGSYATDVERKLCDILIIYNKNNNPVSCIEVRHNSIRQAKLKSNSRVINDKNIYDLVIDYAKKTKLDINTNDLKEIEANIWG